MLEWLKSAWASWRVRITVVGGTLVVATAYGTCSFDPQEVSEVQVEPETEQVGENTANTVPVTETSGCFVSTHSGVWGPRVVHNCV